MTPDVLDIILKKLEVMDSRIVDLGDRVAGLEVKVDGIAEDHHEDQAEKKNAPLGRASMISLILGIALSSLNLLLFVSEHFH